MPANVQELRHRIKATKSIKQITKAMEMIAASKMRRAQTAALQSRPYADLAWEMVGEITAKPGEKTHPLQRKSSSKKTALTLVIEPNRGLCGSLPTQVSVKALETILDVEQRYISVGRKAGRALARAGSKIIADFDGFENQPTTADVKPIVQIIEKTFLDGEVDVVYAVYADFVSTLAYKVKRVQLLPIEKRDLDIGTVIEHKGEEAVARESIEFLFEPSAEEVLSALLPRLLGLTVYQIIVEAIASEHSSRMVTMQNASKAADDLIEEFTLTYNSVRQAAITAEIAEITGGRLAVAA